jgi:HEAT repeat protein
MGGDVVEDLVAAYPALPEHGRAAALDVVARLRPLGATEWLVGRLAEPSPDVRARACHALGAIGDPYAGPALLDGLDDVEWPVRAQAAKALGRIGFTDATRALRRRMRDECWWVRANSAEALRSMGPAGRAALESALDDDDPFARQQAVLKLEESGVVERQVALLVAGGDDERDAAQRLLRRVVAAGGGERLRALARSHPEAHVRRALKTLLPLADEAA